MHSDGKNMTSLRKATGGVMCPATKGVRTRFMSIDSYSKLCDSYQRGQVSGWGNVAKTLYGSVCQSCPNNGMVDKELLHGASIITASEVKDISSNAQV